MIIGIDLGTTNSLVAIWRDQGVEIIPNSLGDYLTPSVVGLSDSGDILVGIPARHRLVTHPQRTAAVFKRYMGTDREVSLGNRCFRPEELSALVVRSLKEDAEAFLGEPVREAVITVPAYFNDAQRKATRTAGELAGLKVERLLNEPTAASMAYGLHQNEEETQFLVFDLGGGTFDVSVLDYFDGSMEVRASAGDNFLGGEDFVDVLEKAFREQLSRQHKLPSPLEDPEFQGRLRDALERAKRDLGIKRQVSMTVPLADQALEWSITLEEFEARCEPLMARIKTPIERALRDARIRTTELDQIILAGGSSRLPLIRGAITRMFGRMPFSHLDPDELIVRGAAIQAGLKMRHRALDEIVMVDVSPYTLGIAVSEPIGPDQILHDLFLPIIERNTVIPSSRSKEVSTLRDNQRQITVAVYQGEARMANDNIHLESFNMAVPPKPAGEVSVDVRFTYDINGLLQVEATEMETGSRQSIVIEENPGALTEAEIKTRLAALETLKIHPRDQAENAALKARADKLYEQLLGERRETLSEHINQFEAVLERQDPHAIRDRGRQLSQILDELEGNPYL